MNKKAEIAKALAVTAELTGTDLSKTGMEIMINDLAVYDLGMVLKALNRCRRELTGRLTLASILQRIDTGLPSADEAFGMLIEGWKNENLTVVVPEIAMSAAGNGAYQLFIAGDKTGARMAFRDTYERMAVNMQEVGGRVDWFVSRGNDRGQAVVAIMEAVKLGRLEPHQAAVYLPTEAQEERLLLSDNRLLSLEEKTKAKQNTQKLIQLLANKIVVNG